MGLNDEKGNPFLGGVWQFNVARVGVGIWDCGKELLAHLAHENAKE